MIKGLAITPPVIGRISIGKVVEKDGKRLPQKDDQFTLTTQMQGREGWILHPLDKKLRETSAQGKLRTIPIQLLFNQPDLNCRVQYSLFDRNTARPVCVGNGETCKRTTASGIDTLPCPSPQACDIGANGHCKPYGRLNVIVGDDDPLSSFIFRTTGFNSIRTLVARLHYFNALSGGRLACLPLALKLRGKSTRQSFGQPIFYADITLRDDLTLEQTLNQASEIEQQRISAGFNQAALDQTAQQGFNNGAFEEAEDDVDAIVEEFYPAQSDNTSSPHPNPSFSAQQNYAASQRNRPSLADKIDQQAQALSA
ncbi:hydrolase or metal-binding protein [Thiomicrospira sp. ALE5]|uniref:recombination directionality factor n=1 Tax=Thiomicrospira sp. ALE5 TaxID=748650 RepID=UPI0008F34938|nr:hydrolase or metal-binding protein [Thiomicrospira sp. ALE5]SFR52688.1 hypothetical protein SAMN03092900_0732 [Thiomicrospira sp. ALE5]